MVDHMRFYLADQIDILESSQRSGFKDKDLVETCIEAVQDAWEFAIKPRMTTIRDSQISDVAMKDGVDFFTEADIESERVIKEVFSRRFGANELRLFGEEAGEYEGNLEAPITIRIDPIDGTANFKFGKPGWGIMVGAYEGREQNERQIVSATYFPEYYEEIIFRIAAHVYKADLRTGEVTQFRDIEEQNNPREVIVSCHKNDVFERRGSIEKVCEEIERRNIRIHSGGPANTKEAIETRGRRIIMIEGDYDQVDFILYSALVALGYRIFDFDGTARNVDDPAISYSNFLLVPPGTVGDTIREIIRDLYKRK